MTELDDMRREQDNFFAHDPQSPLTIEQQRAFRGLSYFPENPELRLKVVLTPPPDLATVAMITSTGEERVYSRVGRFRFTVGDEEAELTIFDGPHGLFMPFVDSLAGKETYAAGRYLEPEQLPDGRYLVDFNLAYNPYCAYNANWSCPITPLENRLPVPIRAGERIFALAAHSS